MIKSSIERRKNIRFRPEPLVYALIDKVPEQESFHPELIGLIVNESYGGCELAILLESSINEGDRVKITLGESGILKAQVSWQIILDDRISRVGLKYLID